MTRSQSVVKKNTSADPFHLFGDKGGRTGMPPFMGLLSLAVKLELRGAGELAFFELKKFPPEDRKPSGTVRELNKSSSVFVELRLGTTGRFSKAFSEAERRTAADFGKIGGLTE